MSALSLLKSSDDKDSIKNYSVSEDGSEDDSSVEVIMEKKRSNFVDEEYEFESPPKKPFSSEPKSTPFKTGVFEKKAGRKTITKIGPPPYPGVSWRAPTADEMMKLNFNKPEWKNVGVTWLLGEGKEKKYRCSHREGEETFHTTQVCSAEGCWNVHNGVYCDSCQKKQKSVPST
jgi:hypothetical protein